MQSPLWAIVREGGWWCRANPQRWGHSRGVWEALQGRWPGRSVASEGEWPLVLVIFQAAQEHTGTV